MVQEWIEWLEAPDCNRKSILPVLRNLIQRMEKKSCAKKVTGGGLKLVVQEINLRNPLTGIVRHSRKCRGEV